MAFKMEYTQHQGFFCTKENSYIKVSNLSGSKTSMTAQLMFFHVKDGLFYPVKESIVPFTPDLSEGAPNMVKQAYLAAKATQEFQTAEDC